MGNSTTLSAALTALAESIAPALEGKPMPGPATIYAALIRARDEAVCLEARASARDDTVHRLVAEVDAICTKTAAHAAAARAGNHLRIGVTPFRSRFAERTAK